MIETAPKYLTTYDLAALFECSRMSICRWLKAGKLPEPAFEIGGGFQWTRLDIENFLVDGGGIELVGAGGAPLPDVDDDTPLGKLIEHANELADEAERLLAKSKCFEQQLRLEYLLTKRELGIAENQEIRDDGEDWKLK